MKIVSKTVYVVGAAANLIQKASIAFITLHYAARLAEKHTKKKPSFASYADKSEQVQEIYNLMKEARRIGWLYHDNDYDGEGHSCDCTSCKLSRDVETWLEKYESK